MYPLAGILAASESTKDLLYPKLSELILGAIAFAVIFVFMAKWVIPRINETLEARRDKIQGDLEKAEQTRQEAEKELSDYRQQLAGAREEANRDLHERSVPSAPCARAATLGRRQPDRGGAACPD